MKIKINRHDGHGEEWIADAKDSDTLFIGKNAISACFFDMLKKEAESKALIRLGLTEDGDILFTRIEETA